MKFTDFFTRSSTRAPVNTGMIVGRLYGNTLLPTGVLSANTALTNSDIYAVTTLISSDIASMTWHHAGPAQDALNKPNDYTSSFNFWQSVTAKMLLYGNSYVLINRQGDTVTGFEQLQDDQVESVLISDDGKSITYEVRFNDDRPTAYYQPNEILHFKLISMGSNINDQYFGKSPLLSLAPEIGLTNLSNKLAETALQNGINPSVLISIPEAQLDKEVKDSIRDGFVDSTTGANYGKPIVIDSSAKLDTLDISPEVSKLLTNLSFTKTQISKAFGVPDSFLMGQGDQQSSIDMIKGMYNTSIGRYKNAIQSELQLKLGLPITINHDILDDELINRLVTLTDKGIISPVDANIALKEKGII
ncbi:phage portal protein [Leuconostoc lactis]|uniref:phage portal protein n=2 Tax=Leuconostoc lactis TaxID=1246 RepID=UPI00241C8381|nr:phage portal protein [Leuconostoc lactis]